MVAQQILSILSALAAGSTRFVFEGREINLVWSCGIFITMNPGGLSATFCCSRCRLFVIECIRLLLDSLKSIKLCWSYLTMSGLCLLLGCADVTWQYQLNVYYYAILVVQCHLTISTQCLLLGCTGRTVLPYNPKSVIIIMICWSYLTISTVFLSVVKHGFHEMFQCLQQIEVVCSCERYCVLPVSIGNYRQVCCEIFRIWRYVNGVAHPVFDQK